MLWITGARSGSFCLLLLSVWFNPLLFSTHLSICFLSTSFSYFFSSSLSLVRYYSFCLFCSLSVAPLSLSVFVPLIPQLSLGALNRRMACGNVCALPCCVFMAWRVCVCVCLYPAASLYLMSLHQSINHLSLFVFSLHFSSSFSSLFTVIMLTLMPDSFNHFFCLPFYSCFLPWRGQRRVSEWNTGR